MRRLAMILTAATLAATAAARADLTAAQRYLAASRTSSEAKDFGDAAAQLELAEAELEGVAAEARGPVVATIEGMRRDVALRQAALNVVLHRQHLASSVAAVEGAIGSLATWDGSVAQLENVLADAEVNLSLPDEVAAARARLATFRQLNVPRAAAARIARAEAAVQALETLWANAQSSLGGPESPDPRVETVAAALAAARRSLAGIPPADAAALVARVDAVGEPFVAAALADVAAEHAIVLRELWEEGNFGLFGWHDERTGVTLAELAAGPDETTLRLNAPQTVSVVARAEAFLRSRDDDGTYQRVASAPAVRAVVDQIRADRDAGRAKLEGFATRLIEEAERTPADARPVAALRAFADGLGQSLPGSPLVASLTKRARATIERPNAKVVN